MSIFVRFGATQGEATDSNHHGLVEVDDFDLGVARQITSHPGTRSDRESANMETEELTLTRYMDKASPALVLEACCGRGKDLTLHVTKTGSGNGSDTFLEYTLRNALVSGYEVYACSQARQRPSEELTISFTSLEMRYTPYDDDGNPEAPIAVGFDPTTNKKL